MDIFAQVRKKARFAYYWVTGLWHVFGIMRQSCCNFKDFEEKSHQLADFVEKRRAEIEAMPDSELQDIFLSDKSSRYDRALAGNAYLNRHGVSLFVDIAIADTDRFLQLQQDPKFDDPKVQEAYFVQQINQLLQKIKVLDKNSYL